MKKDFLFDSMGNGYLFGDVKAAYLFDNKKVMDEWDYILNKDLDPKVISPGSHLKAWWKCSKCGHKWRAPIGRRVKGSKCPCCANRIVIIGINDLATTYPEIAKEWHPTKNEDLTPQNVTSGSNKRVWWKCSTCGHEWVTSINHRISGDTGCIKCHRFKNKNIENSLEKTHPEIAADWDFTKNGNYRPDQFRKGSGFLAWWKCTKCGNEIQKSINVYNGCPKCQFFDRTQEENLLVNNSALMSEWNYERNSQIDPKLLTIGSNQKVWWKCSKCGHEWATTIYHRAMRGTGCPHCHHSKRNTNSENSLTLMHPDIAENWHPTKNGDLTPSMFSKGSRYKVWWKCSKCGHEWEKTIKSYCGCSQCKSSELLKKNSLSLYSPELVNEWNYEKNDNLIPEKLSYSSNQVVWWKCSKCSYEWKARISNRAILKRGCPCCANKKVVVGVNDLSTTHPEMAKEWHPTKNEGLTPQNVSHGSGKKVWWLCPFGHSYRATILHRTSDRMPTSCSVCNSGRQTSFAEQAVFYYVKKLYPDAINRYKSDFLGKMELDIYIPSIKYAIEYDGEVYHKRDTLKREQIKYKICHENGIKLIRLREKMPKIGSDIADHIFSTEKLYEPQNLERMIIYILKRINFSSTWLIKCPIDVNVERDRFEIQKYRPFLLKDSLLEKFPKIAEEWHPTKNGELKPNMFKPGSNHKAWWKCLNCRNEYEAGIGKRTAGTGCPKCAIQKVNQSKRRAVDMISSQTNEIIRTFNSITEASKTMRINSSNISMVCSGQRPFAGGYKWKYKKQ